jgi:D-serine deaminase-like pyridoxal phosphate-dependent protein
MVPRPNSASCASRPAEKTAEVAAARRETVSRRRWLQAGAAALAAGPFVSGGRAATAARPRAEVDLRLERGQRVTKDELPTPALLLDRGAFEANVARMAAHARAEKIALRPHAKTHKCVEIAKRQLAAGALGVCTATIHEAEAMAAGGIGGLLITSELVGPEKIGRLLRLTAQAPETMAVVDHPEHVRQLGAAAAAAKITLNLLIDIDPGGRRTGVAPGEPAIALARTIVAERQLRLRGIHSYAGPSSHVTGFEARRTHSHRAMAGAIDTWHALRRDGLPLEILSGGSTGTYNIDPELGTMTELQVGSYVFMDVDYRRIGGKGGAVYDDFRPALTVLATVISRPHAEGATVDAGLKAFATDRRFGPEPVGLTGVEFSWGGDEHGMLKLVRPSRPVALGDRVEFIVPHCDPNVNLYDRMFVVSGDTVETSWEIARGYG